MAPLITLLIGSMAARIVGWLGVDYVDTWVKAIAVGLAAMFVLTGVGALRPATARQPDRDRAAAATGAGITGQLHRGAGIPRRGGPVGSGYPDRWPPSACCC